MAHSPEQAETLRRVREALATMDELPRAVFERASILDIGYRQIAAELSITPAEVEHHLAEALVHIERALSAAEGDQQGPP
jgi:DNA-directed RNA polymerase specialized sigma24 family protein